MKLGRYLLVVPMVVSALVLTATGDANASTGNHVVVSSVTRGACHLELLATWDGNGNDYAAARITSTNNGFTCGGVLQRSTNGGQTWSDVSSWHYVDNGQAVTTYDYWDGAGYLARVYGTDFTDFPAVNVWTGSW